MDKAKIKELNELVELVEDLQKRVNDKDLVTLTSETMQPKKFIVKINWDKYGCKHTEHHKIITDVMSRGVEVLGLLLKLQMMQTIKEVEKEIEDATKTVI